MTCSKKNEHLLHALMDGELDAMNAIEFEAHLAGCEICSVEYEQQKKSAAPFGSTARSGSLLQICASRSRR
jgi:anti-sigma factor RsiW